MSDLFSVEAVSMRQCCQ